MYGAVSVTNGYASCMASPTAAAQKAGMSAAMFAELMAVIGLANTTNRLANGYQVAIDDRFRTTAPMVGGNGEASFEEDAPGVLCQQQQQRRHAQSPGPAESVREA